MAIDKGVDSGVLDAGLTTVANAIRARGGTSAQLSFPSGMAAAVAAIPEGGDYDITVEADGAGQILHIVDASGGGGVLFVDNEVTFQGGTSRSTFVVPCPDTSKTHYILIANPLDTWLNVGGTWVRQSGIVMPEPAPGLYYQRRIYAKLGTTLNLISDHQLNLSGNVAYDSSLANLVLDTVNDRISCDLGGSVHYISSSTVGITYKYLLIGW